MPMAPCSTSRPQPLAAAMSSATRRRLSPRSGATSSFNTPGCAACRVCTSIFWQVTGDALDYTLETLGLSDPSLRERLMQLYLSLDAFPEVPAVLQRLKSEGYATAVLSNGSPSMLTAAVNGAGIGPLLDHVISIEDAGVFKTHPRTYQLAVDRLGIPRSAISFQSSNAWDAHAASAFGMRVVWCNRYGQRRERLPGSPDREIRTLAELPALLTRA